MRHERSSNPHGLRDRPGLAIGAAYIDGRYLPIGEARIPITDWGDRRSDATDGVVGVYGRAFFRPDDHIGRFRASVPGAPRVVDGVARSTCGYEMPARSARGRAKAAPIQRSQLPAGFRDPLGLVGPAGRTGARNAPDRCPHTAHLQGVGDELAIACNLPPLPADELRDADEIFLATTAGGIMPVSRIDGRTLGGDRPGRISAALRARFWARRAEG